MSWIDLVERAANADIVILGETHTDAIGHAVQRELTDAVLKKRPTGALALEMLERDEQPLVDDWMEGVLDTKRFAALTDSTEWAGPGSWIAWYQPMLDAARDVAAPIVAANAPRRYVRLARTDGYDKLRTLSPPRSHWFVLPSGSVDANYRERFVEVMSGDHGENATSNERIELLLQSQRVWDATMADSIARSFERGRAPVIHIVGKFHSDFRGGIVAELRDRLPGADVVVVSLVPESATSLRSEDEGRGDFVIYTR